MKKLILCGAVAVGILISGCGSDNDKEWTLKDYIKNPGHTPIKKQTDKFFKDSNVDVFSKQADKVRACLSNKAYDYRKESDRHTVLSILKDCNDAYLKNDKALDKYVNLDEFIAAFGFDDEHSETAYIKNEIINFLRAIGMNDLSYQYVSKEYKLNYKNKVPNDALIKVYYKADNRYKVPQYQITGLKFKVVNAEMKPAGYDVELLTY